MPDFDLPIGAARCRITLPAAHSLRTTATPPAELAATQAAIARYLPDTLAKVRARLTERLPAEMGKQSSTRAYRQVMLCLPDDSRRVGFDPWLGELADGIAASGGSTSGGGEEIPVQGFVLGGLEDPPLGLRLIRHLGEDFCGRFAVESHRADHEEDHDPEQEGLDSTVLQEQTLYVAVRPLFEFPHGTNDLAVFLGRGLLARPIAEIIENAALDAALTSSAAALPLADPLTLALPALPAGYAAVLGPVMPHVVDAPFLADHRGEPVLQHAPASTATGPAAATDRFDTVITATGGNPTDLWFANLLTAALAAGRHLNPGGRLIVAGACDEGLPFPELNAALKELQDLPPAAALDRMRHRAGATENVALRANLLRLGAILAHAGQLIFASPGLVSEEDDDESERIRREIPAGPRLAAHPTLESALAQPVNATQPNATQPSVSTGSIGVVET